MFQLKEFPKDNTQVLLNRLDEMQQIVSELARIVMRGPGDFRTVWDITNQVVDNYYRPRVNAA